MVRHPRLALLAFAALTAAPAPVSAAGASPACSGAWVRPSWPAGEPRFPDRRLAWFQLPNAAVVYRKELEVPQGVLAAAARIETPGHLYLLVDGREAFSHPAGYEEGRRARGGAFDVDLTPHLGPGRHVLLAGAPAEGFTLAGTIERLDGSSEALATDGSWRAAKLAPGTAHEYSPHALPGFDDPSWAKVEADPARAIEVSREALLEAWLRSGARRLARRLDDAEWRLELIARRGIALIDGEAFDGGGPELAHAAAVARARRELGGLPRLREAAGASKDPEGGLAAFRAALGRAEALEGAVEAASLLLFLDQELRHLEAAALLLREAGASPPAVDLGSARERVASAARSLDSAERAAQALAALREARAAAATGRRRLEEAWGHPLARRGESRFSKLGWIPATSMVGGELGDWGIRVEPSEAPEAVRAPASWRFQLDPEGAGLDAGWHTVGFNIEDQWPQLKVPGTWEGKHKQANPRYPGDHPFPGKVEPSADGPYNGFAWYRARLRVPEGWRGADVEVRIGWADDFDWTYLNGELLGATGPDAPGWTKAPRRYTAPRALVRFGDENVLAVRVYDAGGDGGLGPVELRSAAPFALAAAGGRPRVVRSPFSPGVLLQARGDEIALWGLRDGDEEPAAALPLASGAAARRAGAPGALSLYRRPEDGPLADNWALLWAPFRGADRERPVEVVLERAPESIEWKVEPGGAAALRLRFGQAGARAALVRSVRLAPPRDGEAIAPEHVERLRAWSRELLRYPTSYTEAVRASPSDPGRVEVLAAYEHESLANEWSAPEGPPPPSAPVPVLLAYALQCGWRDAGIDVPVRDTGLDLGKYGTYQVAPGTSVLRYHYPRGSIPRLAGFTSWVFMPWDAGVEGNDLECEAVALTGSSSYRPQHNFAGEKAAVFADYCREHGIAYINNPDNVLGEKAWDKEAKLPRTEVWVEHCRALVAQFAGRGRDEVVLDLINEAANMKASVYNPLVKRLTEEVRRIDPDRLLYVETCQSWGAVEEFPSLEPTGDPRTVYSFHDYNFRLRGEERWPRLDADVRSLYRQWLPAFEFMARHQAPIGIGEFGGYALGAEHGPHAVALLLDKLRVFDQFQMHFHYYPGRGVLWPRADGSLRPSQVAHVFWRYFGLGYFNRLFPGFEPIPGSTLAVHPANPSAFVHRGKPVALIGDYTWGTFSDAGYDFTAMLDTLRSNGLNFSRVWLWWGCERFPPPADTTHHVPYVRAGPGQALDGRPRYDLTRFDPAFFTRLEALCAAARERGVFLQLVLFDAWMLKHPHLWRLHAFHRDNNSNGVDGDPRGTGTGTDGEKGFCSLGNPAALEAQKAFAREVVEAVSDFDNVLLEVSNENYYSEAWERALAEYIRARELGRPRRHLVMPLELPNHDHGGIKTWRLPQLRAALLGARSLRQPAVFDTDGIGSPDDATVRAAAWTAFASGGHVSYLDDSLQPGAEHGGDLQGSRRAALRRQLGHLAAFARTTRFWELEPDGGLAKGLVVEGRAFAAASTREVIAYLPAGGAVRLDLTRLQGRLEARWHDPREGGAGEAFDLQGGAERELRAPDERDWALRAVVAR
ncbi:MAG: cellulase family glycosylhydrolase [Planctomycetes bacterium]|nr:cellulase family glycosylhydrolase [Planctomycetota bacterium]